MSSNQLESSEEPKRERSRVVVAACPSYLPDEVATALTEVAETLGGWSSFITPGQTVLIKPNAWTRWKSPFHSFLVVVLGALSILFVGLMAGKVVTVHFKIAHP